MMDLGSILDDLPVAVWVGKVPDGAVVYTNRAFERILGIAGGVQPHSATRPRPTVCPVATAAPIPLHACRSPACWPPDSP